MNNLTQHAYKRSQQRGIPPFVMELILDYGSCLHRHGADVYYLDKSGRRALKRELGAKIYARIEDQLNVYVVSDSNVITVAHRNERIKH
jgi:hypothetical protein